MQYPGRLLSGRSNDSRQIAINSKATTAILCAIAALWITPTPAISQTPIIIRSQANDFLTSIFSPSIVMIVLGILIISLLVSSVSRRFRPRRARLGESEWLVEGGSTTEPESPKTLEPEKTEIEGTPIEPAVIRVQDNTEPRLFGAYRVDQEVGKLVIGQAHRLEVLSSRAANDRRAIETSLLKILATAHSDEAVPVRARRALEQYGFVARQCATLLSSPEPFDRAAAARILGEVKSDAALPFLLESLYDHEATVRNQALASIAELRLPSAIGALLDIAGRQKDLPTALLLRSLSYCSFDDQGLRNLTQSEPVPEIQNSVSSNAHNH